LDLSQPGSGLEDPLMMQLDLIGIFITAE